MRRPISDSKAALCLHVSLALAFVQQAITQLEAESRRKEVSAHHRKSFINATENRKGQKKKFFIPFACTR